MNTKKLSFLSINCLLLMACGSSDEANENEHHNETHQSDSISVQYESSLRPAQNDWNWGVQYTDTLVVVETNFDYDYAFNVYEDKQGNQHTIFGQDIIIDANIGSQVEVVWKLDTLYEAGEGDAPYLAEWLVEYTVLRSGSDFSIFVESFLRDYTSTASLVKYIHPKARFQLAQNPGAMCFTEHTAIPFNMTGVEFSVIDEFRNIPDGGFCEGYEGAENGIYYRAIDYEETPILSMLAGNGDVIEELIPLPSEYWKNPIREVTVIVDQQHAAYLYFILIDNRWWLILQNQCDCSA